MFNANSHSLEKWKGVSLPRSEGKGLATLKVFDKSPIKMTYSGSSELTPPGMKSPYLAMKTYEQNFKPVLNINTHKNLKPQIKVSRKINE